MITKYSQEFKKNQWGMKNKFDLGDNPLDKHPPPYAIIHNLHCFFHAVTLNFSPYCEPRGEQNSTIKK